MKKPRRCCHRGAGGWCRCLTAGLADRNALAGRQRLALIVDPMLATGGSMVATIDMLKKAGAVNIRALVLVAAPEGIQAVESAHPDVHIYTASIDSHLNEDGYIIPGLGDAGDRIFGTRQKED